MMREDLVTEDAMGMLCVMKGCRKGGCGRLLGMKGVEREGVRKRVS